MEEIVRGIGWLFVSLSFLAIGSLVFGAGAMMLVEIMGRVLS